MLEIYWMHCQVCNDGIQGCTVFVTPLSLICSSREWQSAVPQLTICDLSPIQINDQWYTVIALDQPVFPNILHGGANLAHCWLSLMSNERYQAFYLGGWGIDQSCWICRYGYNIDQHMYPAEASDCFALLHKQDTSNLSCPIPSSDSTFAFAAKAACLVY